MTKSKKPENTSVSNDAWEKFIEYCNEEGIDLQYPEDWMPWFTCFEAGYKARMEDEDD
jgi:hypothetical protein